MSADVLKRFSPPVSEWFETSFVAPTPPQAAGWPAISSGENTLILSPTGSGKTLAAFLWGLDRLMTEPVPEREARTRLLYLSPLRALAVDVEKNLRSPLRGITLAAERLGEPLHVPTVGMRTGDTPADERRKLVRNPPDLLITTPESLFLMLTSAARETLRNVDAVIIDEIHSVAGTKRGAHMALSLERLEHLIARPVQRIGLSATQRPLEEISRFLGGRTRSDDGSFRWRPVEIVDAGAEPNMDIEVIVPVEDMADLGQVSAEPESDPASSGPQRTSIWPSVHPKILEQIQQHRSTIVFVNSRRLAERLAGRLNELWDEQLHVDTSGRHPGQPTEGSEPGPTQERGTSDGAPPLAQQEGGRGPLGPDPTPGARNEREASKVAAHHGSLSKSRRLEIEDQLKNGLIRAIVATSSLGLVSIWVRWIW